MAKDRKTDAPLTSASDQVYHALRAAILDGSHAPGSVLSRSELADSFGVSPTPVREALLMLERDGLVIVRARSKTTVARIDVLAVHEAFFLRRAIECDVVQRLAKEPNARDLTSVSSLVGGEDRQFHRSLFEALGMGGLHDRLDPLFLPLERCRRMAGEGIRHETVLSEHQEILDRIVAADPQGALRAMEAHLSGELAMLGELRVAHPEYFEGEKIV